MQRVRRLPALPPFLRQRLTEVDLSARLPIDIHGAQALRPENARISPASGIAEQEHRVLGSLRAGKLCQIIEPREIGTRVVADMREVWESEAWGYHNDR